MYPLLLTPPTRDYLWGGERLKTEYNIRTDMSPVAEAWMLSSRRECCCIVENGELKGKTFADAIECFGSAAAGCNVDEFPLLIKLIDAKQALSVQVHPDDEYAKTHGASRGKTEMWYVVDAEPGAQLLYGFSHDVTREECMTALDKGDFLSLCNAVDVHKGDVFFIPSGTLHAIGKGMLIAEVQQNCDTTYRVFDYDRVGADGKKRELHVEHAMNVLKMSRSDWKRTDNKIDISGGASIRTLSSCCYFNAYSVSLNGSFSPDSSKSFVSLVCLDGECSVSWDGGEFTMKKGSSAFIPQSFDANVSGCAELLMSTK